jgi:hypothetical protein
MFSSVLCMYVRGFKTTTILLSGVAHLSGRDGVKMSGTGHVSKILELMFFANYCVLFCFAQLCGKVSECTLARGLP